MPSFRDRLLADVTSICQQLYQRRLETVRTQQLVSEKSKQDIHLLIGRLEGLRRADPFPDEASLDLAPLDGLKTKIDEQDGDDEVIQRELMDWVKGIAPMPDDGDANEPTATAAIDAAIPPINQRMLDALSLFRSTVDKTRVRLLRDRDRYDREAYTAARNDFTLARSVYGERLRLGQVEATNEGCAKMEQVLLPAVETATGDSFPDAIQAGADFLSNRIFA